VQQDRRRDHYCGRQEGEENWQVRAARALCEQDTPEGGRKGWQEEPVRQDAPRPDYGQHFGLPSCDSPTFKTLGDALLGTLLGTGWARARAAQERLPRLPCLEARGLQLVEIDICHLCGDRLQHLRRRRAQLGLRVSPGGQPDLAVRRDGSERCEVYCVQKGSLGLGLGVFHHVCLVVFAAKADTLG
jgi:hypothetical protein